MRLPLQCIFDKTVLVDIDPDFSWPLHQQSYQARMFVWFLLQFQADPHKTPVENALAEWKEEDSPPVRVARQRSLDDDCRVCRA